MKKFNLAACMLLFQFGVQNMVLSQMPIKDLLLKEFKNPPARTRPIVWWRWYGRQISKAGITRDFEEMKKVGIGGVYHFQLKPNLPDVTNNPNSVLPNVQTLSKEWWDLMQFSIKEADRLGLEFRVHNSLGWSASGGPWITPEKSMQKLIWANAWVNGNQAIQLQLPQPKVDAKWNFYKDVAVIAIKINPADSTTVAKSDVLDISKYMSSQGVLTWQAPEGKWKIIRYGHTTTGKTPVQGPAEGEGLECDKMDRNAVKIHFDNYPGKILKDAGSLTGKSLTTIAFDSYEGGVQNWNHRFREQFIKRRGYDPLPWLPVLRAPVGHGDYDPRNKAKGPELIIENKNISERFIYDFERTIAELFMDEYYSPMDSLVHQFPKVRFEVQSYNAPFNLVENAVKNEFPAGEFWHNNKNYGWWTLSLAASAAHIRGEAIVGAEAFTTEPQHGNWSVGLEELKAEADLAFSKGINSMEMHIQAHQPWPTNIKPGMIGGNYGLQVNPGNTFWQQSLAWNTYLARAQYLLRQGKFVGDVCYLYPRGQRGFSVPEGYNGDAIDEVSFVKLMRVKNGEWVLPSGMRYKVLVLTNTQTMTLALAEKLQQLIAEGGVVIGPKPLQTPSLENYPTADIVVKKIGETVWNNCNGTSVTETTFGKGKVFWNREVTDILNLLGVKKDVAVEDKAPKESIVWTHRKTTDTDIYFVANQLNKPQNMTIKFRVSGKVPQLWNAETGTITEAVIWNEKEGVTSVTIPFQSLQSWFVIFKPTTQNNNPVVAIQNGTVANGLVFKQNQLFFQSFENGSYKLVKKEGNPKIVTVANLPQPLSLNSDWQVDFKQVQGTPRKIDFPSLLSWTNHTNKNIQYFSGTATYTKTIVLNEQQVGIGKLVQLDLGNVKNFAEVAINGKSVGLLWKSPYVFDISNFVQVGNNSVEVKVTNLLANRMIGDEQEPEDMTWSEPSFSGDKLYKGRKLLKYPDWFINGQPRPSVGRYTFSTWNYYRKDDPLLPSGLLGPVKVVFGKEEKL